MIPITDNVLNRRKPIVTYYLIGINIVFFLWELKLELSDQLQDFINSWGIIPALFSDALTHALGGNAAAGIVVLIHLPSLLIGIFLYSSFSQILGNLIFLWVFGKTIENTIGHCRCLGFYLIAGILSSLLQILMEPSLTAPIIGSNGVIASILGAYISAFPKAKIDTILPIVIVFIPVELPAFIYLFWWFVQQLFYSIGSLDVYSSVGQSGSSYLVQVVGLLFGAAFMRFLRR